MIQLTPSGRLTFNGREWADAVISNVEVHLDWKDRIRALFGSTIHVRVVQYCAKQPGETAGTSSVYVDSILPHKPEEAQMEAGA